ncbi:MAG TPA: NAD(P)/FAD-dependent oxidoreductase [Anaerolineales bacterium]|nr:NAD(P)/FAD-dependent oxidoreductase [Anaerolineales bacterium]
MRKKVLIIGAGIAGLAAGCYGQMNGFDTEIFELHDLPGGLCTAWERKGYIFDGCIHYLFGSGPDQPFNDLWRELGALEERRMIDHEAFMQVRSPDGQQLTVYCDPDRLAAHMKEISPGDAELIDDLAEGVREFVQFDMSVMQQKPKSLMSPQDWQAFGMQMMPFVAPLAKWGMLSAAGFARRFHHPFLQRAVAQMFAWPEIPMMAGLSLLAYMHTHNAGFPAGGSLAFAQAIERRYLALGGKIHYKAQVEKILVEPLPGAPALFPLPLTPTPRKRAAALRLYDDSIHRGDYIISAADGRGTIFDLLGGEFTNRKIENLYDGDLPLRPQVQVSLGVNRDLSTEPHWAMYLLEEPLLIAGREYTEIGIKHYCFDPSLAPAGKSSVVVMLESPYAYWQRIYGRRLYDTEQAQVAEIVIDFLERLYPGIKQEIEVTDVATPLSFERYTGNWQGSCCGWLLTTETMRLMIEGVAKTLPGLEDFYMAGQWVEPGGSVPLAAASGRNAIQLICHAEGQKFAAGMGAGPA